MDADFDPYYLWLSIPPEQQPPDHYTLLGLTRFEGDRGVIESAADQRMAHLRTFQSGRHSEESQKLLNEVSVARVCLLDPGQRAAYDAELRKRLTKRKAASRKSAESQRRPAKQPSRPAEPMVDIQITDAPSRAASRRPHGKKAEPAAGQKRPFNPLLLGAAAVGIVVIVICVGLLANSGSRKTAKNEPVKKTKKDAGGFDFNPDDFKFGEEKPKGSKPPNESTSGANTKPSAKPPVTPEKTQPNAIQPVALPADWQAEKPFDLMPHIDPSKHLLAGRWVKEEGAIVSDARESARLAVPVELPPEYDLYFEVTREKANESFVLHLRAGEHWFNVAIDGFAQQGGLSGIELIDGKRCSNNETANPAPVLFQHVPTPLLVRVRSGRIRVEASGKVVADWRGDTRRLSVPDHYAGVEKIPVVGSWRTQFRVTKLELRFPQPIETGTESTQPPPKDQPPTKTIAKHPLPSQEQQTAANAKLTEMYGLATLVSEEEKLKAAEALLESTAEESDPVLLFARYRLAIKFAVEGGDAVQALSVVEVMGEKFQLDVPAAQQKVAADVMKLAVDAQRLESLDAGIQLVIDRALADDRADAALATAESAHDFARKRLAARDYRKPWFDRVKKLRELKDLWEPFRQAQETLKTDPENAAANQAAAHWYCVVRADWRAGLPHLAKIDDAAVRELAQRELAANEASVEELADLADAWWKAADAADDAVAGAYKLRAVEHYQRIRPGIKSVVTRAQIDRRLEQSASIPKSPWARKRSVRRIAQSRNRKSQPIAKLPVGEWVDILKHVDTRRDAVRGTWWRDGDQLVAGHSSHTRLIVPVMLDGDYDFEMEFTRHYGLPGIGAVLPIRDRQIQFGLSMSDGAYHAIRGVERTLDPNHLPTLVRPGTIEPDRRYQTQVRVRYMGPQVAIQVDLDNRTIIDWTGDVAGVNLTQRWRLPYGRVLALGTNRNHLTIHQARLRLVNGSAAPLAEIADQQRRFRRTAEAGGDGGNCYETFVPAGQKLIGLAFSAENQLDGKNGTISSVQPVFGTPENPQLGEHHGNPTDGRVQVIARPGYALGGVAIRWDGRVHSMQLIFMRDLGDRLDPNDVYRSEWFGRQGNFRYHSYLGGTGEPVIGLCGGKGRIIDRLSLILQEPEAAARTAGLELQGYHQHVATPLMYDGAKPLTIEAIATPGLLRTSDHASLVSNMDRSGVGLHIHNGHWALLWSRDGGFFEARSDAPAELGRRVHVAGVYDGRTTRLYLDGTLQQQTANITAPYRPSKYPFKIGCDPNDQGHPEHGFHGTVHAVRISSDALYDGQRFTRPETLTRGKATELLYLFDEAAGTAARDSSGHHRDGKLLGPRWVFGR